MILKWFGPLALLAALVIGDQIRKLGISQVEAAIHPDRVHNRGGHTRTAGDAIFVDLGGGKNLVALLAHIDKTLDLDGTNYVALRAYTAAGGKQVSFNAMSRQTGIVPVTGALIPVLVSFADPANPGTARAVSSDDLAGALGTRFRRRARRARDAGYFGQIALAERAG